MDNISRPPFIIWHDATITREQREKQNRHKGIVLWFTGLSGSGKSTLAHALEEHLHQRECHTFVLDGDNLRHGLCRDLGFSAESRRENIRRAAEVAKLFVEAGMIALTAFISPFQADRQQARKLIGPESFVEIYCQCPLDVCEQRDSKGLYQKARAGLIAEFTGISSPYEEPEQADLVLNTATHSVEACVAIMAAYLQPRLSDVLDLATVATKISTPLDSRT
ncbi:MAG: adenylyl-sulfate kinase [Magnetococcales bacterium]|nr:adenylyl-sulfate kinase [Magnetococcales bacterium]